MQRAAGAQWLHARGGTPWRQDAIRRAFAWIEARAGAGGVGAIFPPMVYWQIVLHALGYERTHPLVQRAEAELDRLEVAQYLLGAIDRDEIQVLYQPQFACVDDRLTGAEAMVRKHCSRMHARLRPLEPLQLF